MSEQKNKYIGQSVPRLEDRPLVTGAGRFAADVNFPDQLHMRVVRSPVAHGRLRRIDASAALAMDGVFAVWTFEDVAHIPPIDFRLTGLTELEPYRQYALAQDMVRYVGEPVAAVFARDAYLAEDAADAVELDIEPLPVVLDAADKPGPFDAGHDTEATILVKQSGDVDAAFRNAHIVVELDLATGRHSGVPMETRGAIARYDAARDVLEMHGAAKVPHWNRDRLARMLGRPVDSVQLYEGHVGGGFGIRGEMYPEDVLVCAAALKFKRAVKWIEDRREHLIAANHSRQQRHRIRAAVAADGQILGIDDTFFHDNGAYMRTHAATVPDLAAAMLPGPYRVPAYRATGHIRLTNKTPCGTYRSPGRYETTFVRERLMDVIAARLNLDRIELRRRNLIDKSAMPYDRGVSTLGTDVVYDSGDYATLIDKLLAMSGWDAMQQDCARRRAAGELAGCGFGMFVEKSGLGPFDKVRIEVAPSGAIELVTGVASIGQGVETAMAQICAETLGVDYRGVTVTHGQTDRIDKGMGAFASRVTVMCGEATRMAAVKLRETALAAAAELMQTAPATLDIVDGEIVRTGTSGPSMTLGALAESRGGRLTAEAEFRSSHMVYPYGAHVVQVKLDADTGGLAIERYFVAYDVGRAVNPKMVEGQILGGVAQGLGGALYEEFRYDDNGEPLSVTFADYLMPTAHEMPGVGVIVTEDAPSPLNALGLKGAGEGGITPVGAAIASAIDDAVGRPGAVTEIPVTPQRLKAIIGR
jgi:CO/xanthine dehydrogenase Mo-binding subunit